MRLNRIQVKAILFQILLPGVVAISMSKLLQNKI